MLLAANRTYTTLSDPPNNSNRRGLERKAKMRCVAANISSLVTGMCTLPMWGCIWCICGTYDPCRIEYVNATNPDMQERGIWCRAFDPCLIIKTCEALFSSEPKNISQQQQKIREWLFFPEIWAYDSLIREEMV